MGLSVFRNRFYTNNRFICVFLIDHPLFLDYPQIHAVDRKSDHFLGSIFWSCVWPWNSLNYLMDNWIKDGCAHRLLRAIARCQCCTGKGRIMTAWDLLNCSIYWNIELSCQDCEGLQLWTKEITASLPVCFIPLFQYVSLCKAFYGYKKERLTMPKKCQLLLGYLSVRLGSYQSSFLKFSRLGWRPISSNVKNAWNTKYE